MTPPFISCLCPTWRRPKLLANSIACFEAQDYPRDRCIMLILDDAGQLSPRQSQNGWHILSVCDRLSSLGTKYNNLAALSIEDELFSSNGPVRRTFPTADVLAVWEDDDIYLPHHLKTIAENIEGRTWAKPSHVRSLYTGHDEIERADGRFHASIAMTREAFEKVGGWPETTALNFDQQLFTNLEIITGKGVYQTDDPSYIFRWGSTNAYHGQGLGEDWWEKAEELGDMRPGPIDVEPEFDEETMGVYKGLGYA